MKIISQRVLLYLSLIGMGIYTACSPGPNTSAPRGGKGLTIADSDRYKKPVFDSVTIDKEIFFAEVRNHEDSLVRLSLDLYSPYGDPEEKRPVVVWVHGGGFRSGTKTQKYIVTLATAFARRGYVSLSPDYRLRKDPKEDMMSTIDEAAEDVMKAIGWIRENSDNYGIDKDYIIVAGGSAGGILSTNLCYKDASEGSAWDKNGLVAFVNLWGSPDREGMNKIVDRNDPPTIFIHGVADTIVPYSNCLWLSRELANAGVEYELFPIEGAGHTPVDHMDDIVENISSFLYGKVTGK